MAASSIYTFLSILMLVVPMSVAQRVGGWAPIKDPNDPQVVAVAKFAVEEHNKKAGTSLVYDKVVSGESQVVAGINYRLVISATGSGAATPKTYSAVVYSRQKHLELVSFAEIKG